MYVECVFILTVDNLRGIFVQDMRFINMLDPIIYIKRRQKTLYSIYNIRQNKTGAINLLF